MKQVPSDYELDYLPRQPENRKVPIGCIGSGFIMRDCQIPSYRLMGLNPVAVASRNEEHAIEVAKRFRHSAYPSYQKMLENDSLYLKG